MIDPVLVTVSVFQFGNNLYIFFWSSSLCCSQDCTLVTQKINCI